MFITAASPRKPLFWILVGGFVLASSLFTYHYFEQSYPIISVSISMDRDEALKKAAALSTSHTWLPQSYRSAVEFKNDTFLQYFVELECGGKEGFSELLRSKNYEPYQWHVRHFKEKTTHETSVFFTPSGTPYGFSVKLPETEKKPTLSVHDARALAEKAAVEEWGVSFENYKELETSKDEQLCGRLDHTFVYERTDTQLGTEGKYRLRLVVSGNMLTEVARFVFIPEAFVRRFQELRSTNATVSTCGIIGLQLLYILAGCLIAGFFFFRKRYLTMRSASLWAGFFGVMSFTSIINELPLAWMSYDTATSATSFLLKWGLNAFLQGALAATFFTVIFSIGIVWDQLGFPSRLAFWNLWSAKVGSSLAVFGRTLGGYLYTPIFLAIQTATCLLFTQVFRWWSPADDLVDPNILATYAPWLSPFSKSAQAGFSEEILFRALPLGACMVLGRYFKREKTSIVLGLILQALIFGACHANYPQTPGYFRLLELFVPSLLFGVLYLIFGLIPTIISHFLYDLFLMTLPLFATAGSQLFISKAIIIILGLAPLLIIIYQRIKRGSWYKPTLADCNNALLPDPSAPSFVNPLASAHEKDTPSSDTLPGFSKKILLGGGCLGIMLWIWCTPFTADTPPLFVQKNTALSLADEHFAQEEITTPGGFDWQQLCFISCLPTQMEFFVWREEGKEKYHELLGTYLTPPSWGIRYASFSGNLIDRAQEFTSVIAPDETILRSNLALPESQAGASLQESEARGIALEVVRAKYQLTPYDLKEISAQGQDRPHRKDWTFIFQDKKVLFDSEGEARIQVTIAGDKVSNVYRYVFVPEAWARDEQQSNLYRGLFNFFVIFIKILSFFIALALIQRKILYNLPLKRFFLWLAVLIPLALLAKINGLESLKALFFLTSQPYDSQLFNTVLSFLPATIIMMTILALCTASLKKLLVTQTSTNAPAFFGICAEFALQGAMQVILFLNPRYLPFVPDYSNFSTYSPFFGLVSSSFLTTVQMIVLELVCISAFTLVIRQSQKTWLWGALFFIISSISYTNPLVLYPSITLIVALVQGALFTLIYFLLLQYDQRAVLMMVATRLALITLQQGLLQSYPHLLSYSIVVSSGIMLFSYFWFTQLAAKDSHE